jgi:transcriptional regulator with XRE-family HTH domain
MDIRRKRIERKLSYSQMAKKMNISVERYKELEKANDCMVLRFMKPLDSEIEKLDCGVLYLAIINRRIMNECSRQLSERQRRQIKEQTN